MELIAQHVTHVCADQDYLLDDFSRKYSYFNFLIRILNLFLKQ